MGKQSQRPSPAPGQAELATLSPADLAAKLDAKLEDEAAVLSSIVAGLGDATTTPALFQRLHEAAMRDDRIANLSLAYERLLRDASFKRLEPTPQALTLLHASRFFAEIFGDKEAAINYAERAHQAAPERPDCFDHCEKLLREARDGARLAKFYAQALGRPAEPAVTLARARRAIEALAAFDYAGPELVGLHLQVLSADPTSRGSRDALEQLYTATRRYRDLAKLFEELLAAEDRLPAGEADALRFRLVALYRGDLRDPQKAALHVEALLGREPPSEAALQAAEALLDHRPVAARLAPLLSDAYRRLGRSDDEATTLALELKMARPPRALEVQRRLASLRQDQLGDPAGALEMLEPLVQREPGDDELRARYLAVSTTFHRQLDAAKLLARALHSVTDPVVKARVGLEIGRIYATQGDPRRSQAALAPLLALEVGSSLVLEVARELLGVLDEAPDPKLLATALEKLVELEVEARPRHDAALRLVDLVDGDNPDRARAILGWRALLDSAHTERALDRLQTLYERAGDHAGLVDVLRRRTQRAKSPEEARGFALRTTELEVLGKEPEAAIKLWRECIDRYGASPQALRELAALLEKTSQWTELGAVLEEDASLAQAAERVALLVRLGALRLARLGDPAGALKAYEAALEEDPSDATARRAAEKMLDAGEHRLAAADVLEPVYRATGDAKGLMRALKVRAQLHERMAARLAAYEEMLELAQGVLQDRRRALEIVGEVLRVITTSDDLRLPLWLDRFEALAREVGAPARRAELLLAALGGEPISSAPRLRLARMAAEELVAAGDIARALEIYRRALTFEPSSADLLARLDELLAEQGTPEERLALYESALARSDSPARRLQLLHAVARIKREDCKDPQGAVETWRRLLLEAPGDLAAHEALLEVLEESGEDKAVVRELERGMGFLEGERRHAAMAKLAHLRLAAGEEERALDTYAELLQVMRLDLPVLREVAALAERHGAWTLARTALKACLEQSEDVEERVAELERLGTLLHTHFGDDEGALSRWRLAARESAEQGREHVTLRLHERVLGLRPRDLEAAEQRVRLLVRARAWSLLPDAVAGVLEADPEAPLAAELLTLVEEAALKQGEVAAGLAVAERVLGLAWTRDTRRRRVLGMKANLCASQPELHELAASVYRDVLLEFEEPADVAAFEAFLATVPASEARRRDRRWLFEWRVDRAADANEVLMDWAALEAGEGGDLDAAARLYGRVADTDPERLDALRALARVECARGNASRALSILEALQEKAEGRERSELELSRARLLLETLGRPEEALELLAKVLAHQPGQLEAIALVDQALAEPRVCERAAALLEHASAAIEDATAAVAVLERLLTATRAMPSLGEARARWFERLVDLQSDDADAGLRSALAGAAELPGATRLWDAAERFARRLVRPAPVVTAYREALAQARDAGLAELIGQRLVDFHEEWSEDTGDVLELLQHVLELAPHARWALDRVKLAFNAERRWEELFRLYDRAIEIASDDAEREDLLDEAALAAKDLANDAERAIGYLERLVKLRPKDARLESVLERLYERQGEHRKLIDLLTPKLESAEGAALQVLRARIVEAWTALGNASAALAGVTAMLADDPAEPRAVELLEGMLRIPVQPAGAGKSKALRTPGAGEEVQIRREVIALLQGYYGATRRPADLVRLLEAELEVVGGREERVRRLQDLLRLRSEELHDSRGALGTLEELVRLEPAVPLHRERLDALAEALGERPRQAALLAEVAETVGQVQLRVLLYRESARVWYEQLGDADRAIALHQKILELGAEDPEAGLVAARALDALLEERGRSAERCSVLETLARGEPDPARRRAAWVEVARVAFDEMDAVDRAIAAWHAVLAADPGDRLALDGLDRVLTAAERWGELVAVLRARAAVARDTSERHADRVRVARLLAGPLGEVDQAIHEWRALREELGADEESFEPLWALLYGQGRWEEAAELVSAAAAEAPRAERQRELWCLLGDLHRERTGSLQRALDAYAAAQAWQRAIQTVQDAAVERERSVALARHLLDLCVQQWRRAGASPDAETAKTALWTVQTLIKRLGEMGAMDDVVAVQLEAAALPFEVTQQRSLRRDAAWVTCDRLNDRPRAIAILRDLFREDPTDAVAATSVARYARLLEEGGEDRELAELWATQARGKLAEGDRGGAAALWARAAYLWETKIGDLDRAIEVYNEGAALGGEVSLEALARIYAERGTWRACAAALEWLCGQSSRENLAERSLRLADAYVKLGERQRARERLEQAARTALDAGRVRERLAELYRKDEAWGSLAVLLVDDAELAADNRTRVARLREAAALHVQRRGDPEAAIPLLERALEAEPDDPSTRLFLSEALTAAGHLEEAGAILKAQIERYEYRRPKERALVHLHLARVHLAGGRRAEAFGELDVAAKINPAHPEVLQELCRLSLSEGRLDRAEQTGKALLLVLRRATDAERGGPSRAEVYLDLATIAALKNDPGREAECIESAFDAATEGEVSALKLEGALRASERYGLLARAIEARLGRLEEPAAAARALAELTAVQGRHLPPDVALHARVAERADRVCRDLEREDAADERAWSALSDVYAWLGDPEAEARVLERRVAAIVDGDLHVTDADPIYRLARIRLTDPERVAEGVGLLQRALRSKPDLALADEIVQGALRAAPRSRELLELMLDLARQRDDAARVVQCIADLVELGAGGIVAIREGVDRGLTAGRHGDVVRLLRASVAIEPGRFLPPDAVWMRNELADLLMRDGQVAEAADVREASAALAEPDEARDLLLNVADTALSRLGDPERAARLYGRLLARDPADREAWEPLLEVYRKLGARERLIALIDATVPLVDATEDRSRLRLEQAALLLETPARRAEALTLLEDILVEDPTMNAAAELLATEIEKDGDDGRLAELLTKRLDVVKAHEDVDAVEAVSVRLGALLEKLGRSAEALDVSTAALDWKPKSRLALRAVARLSEAAGVDEDQLAETLEALLAIEEPRQVPALAERLLVLRRRLGDEGALQRALEVVVLADPSHVERREQLLAGYEADGRFRKVAEVLRRALEFEPTSAQLRERTIAAQRKAGMHEEALAVLEAAIQGEPDEPQLRLARAEVLEILRRYDEALEDFQKARDSSDAFAEPLVRALERGVARATPAASSELALRLAGVLEDLGRTDEARGHLSAVLKLNPRHRDALRRLAWLESAAERWEDATAAYRRLVPLEEGEGLVAAALLLADACAQGGRLDDARDALERAARAVPESEEVRERLRAVYQETGAHRELAEMMRQDAAAARKPADRARILLRAGELLLEDKAIDAARAVLEEALALSPDSIEAAVLLARCRCVAGRPEEALEILGELLASYKGRRSKALARVHQEISRIYLERGDLSEALDALRRAFEMDMRNGELAMQLGELALDLDDEEIASRAYRAVTMMKLRHDDGPEGASPEAKGLAYYRLGCLARDHGDLKKARLMANKAIGEVPGYREAQELLDGLHG